MFCTFVKRQNFSYLDFVMHVRNNQIKRSIIRFASSLAYSPGDVGLLSPANLENIKNLLKTAPTIRPPKYQNTSSDTNRKSAVLVPLIVSDNKPAVIFTVRSNVLYKHRGQISFPGGSIEAIDQFDCVRAALRETNEEIGLDLADVNVLGELPSTLGRVSYVLKWGTVVVPVVGLVNQRVDIRKFKFDVSEVSEVFSISLERLCQSEHHGFTQFRNGYSLPLFMSKDGHRIWGLTAIILHQILRILLPSYYKPKLKFLRSVV